MVMDLEVPNREYTIAGYTPERMPLMGANRAMMEKAMAPGITSKEFQNPNVKSVHRSGHL
jgi:hypothetical protein